MSTQKQKDFFQRILVEETLEYKVIFSASQLDINPHPCGGFNYNLSGEFFMVKISAEGNEEEKAFEPPLTYSFTQVRGETSDAECILRDIYQYLQEERSSENNGVVRKIGFL